MEDFEILDHTADVGMRIRGQTLAAVLERATVGLAEIAGLWRPGPGEELELAVEAGDPGALLVDWLNEVLYVLEVRWCALGGVTVRTDKGRAGGRLSLRAQLEPEMAGTPVKAATLHGLDVRPDAGGWIATVYLDI